MPTEPTLDDVVVPTLDDVDLGPAKTYQYGNTTGDASYRLARDINQVNATLPNGLDSQSVINGGGLPVTPEGIPGYQQNAPTTAQFQQHYAIRDRLAKQQAMEEEIARIKRIKTQRPVQIDVAGRDVMQDQLVTPDTPGWVGESDVGNTRNVLKGIGRGIVKTGASILENAGFAATQGSPRSSPNPLDWKREEQASAEERRKRLEGNVLFQKGKELKAWGEEAMPVHRIENPTGWQEQLHNKLIDLGETAGDFIPAVAGRVAPFLFGSLAASHQIDEGYSQLLSEGMDPKEAANESAKRAVKEGVFQGLLMKYFPENAKKLGDKWLDKIAYEGTKGFLAKRSAQAVEGAAFGAASQAGSNVIGNRPLIENVGDAMMSMAGINVFLGRGKTAGEKAHRASILPEIMRAEEAYAKNAAASKDAPIQDVLHPEFKSAVQKAAGTQGKKVIFTDLGEDVVSQIDGKGNILVDELALSNSLAHLRDPRAKQELIDRVMHEESIHDDVSTKQARDFYNSATSAERSLAHKRYYRDSELGNSVDVSNPEAKARYESTIGHEMIRARIQQMEGKSPTEIAYSSGFTKDGVRSLVMMENAIWKLRRGLSRIVYDKSSTGHPVAKQKAILEDVLKKIHKAREMVEEAAPEVAKEAEAVQPEVARKSEPAIESVPEPAAKIPEAAVAAPVSPAPAPVEAPKAAAPAEAPVEEVNPNRPKLELDEADMADIRRLQQQKDNEPFSVNAPKSVNKADGRLSDYEAVADMKPVDFMAFINSRNIKATDAGYVLGSEMSAADRSRVMQLDQKTKAEVEALVKSAGSLPPESRAEAFKQVFDLGMKKQYFNEAWRMHDAIVNVEKGMSQAEAANLTGVGPTALKKIIESRKSDSSPASVNKGMGKKQYLEEQARRLRLMRLQAELEKSGQELPTELKKTLGLTRDYSTEPVAAKPEDRISASEAGALPDVNPLTLEKKIESMLWGEVGVPMQKDVGVAELKGRMRKVVDRFNDRLKTGKFKNPYPTDTTDTQAMAAWKERQKQIDSFRKPYPTDAQALEVWKSRQSNAKRTKYKMMEFGDLAAWAKRNHPNINPDQLRDAWESKVWNHLVNASGERMAQLRHELNLETKYGRRPIADPDQVPQPAKAAQEPEQAQGDYIGSEGKVSWFSRKTVPGGEAKPSEVKARNLKMEIEQRYRNKVFTAIAQKLIEQSIGRRAELNRSQVGIDDVNFSKTRTDFGAYHEYNKNEAYNLDLLNDSLRDGARASSADPETATHRLLAVVDKTNGDVHLLSTYNDAGVQRVTDPTGTASRVKTTRELNKQFLARYRPIASVLLTDPVQSFRQKFDTLLEFNEQFGREANERSRIGEYDVTPEGPADPNFEAEGTPGLEGEGGSFRGPHKNLIDSGTGRGALDAKGPVTRPEALAIERHILKEAGSFDTAEAVFDSMEGLRDLADRKKLTGLDALAASAYRKIFRRLENENPHTDTEELKKRMANRLFDAMLFRGKINFADRIVQRYGRPERPAPDVRPRQEAVELTKRGDIRPPTSQNEFYGPFQRSEAPPSQVELRNPRPIEIPKNLADDPHFKRNLRDQQLEKMTDEELKVAADEARIRITQRSDDIRPRGETSETLERYKATSKVSGKKLGMERAMKIRDRMLRKRGLLLDKATAAKLAGYEGPMSVNRSVKLTEAKMERDRASLKFRQVMSAFDAGKATKEEYIKAQLDWGNASDAYQKIRTNRGEPGEESFSASVNRNKKVTDFLKDVGSSYDEWMVDRIERFGGDVSSEVGTVFRKIIDREKEIYGELTPVLDEARILAGGTRKVKLIGQVPSPQQLKAVDWANNVVPVKGAPFAGTVRFLGPDFEKPNMSTPDFADKLVKSAKMSNMMVGKLMEKVSPGFKASGLFSRQVNAYGYDIIREGRGEAWRKWTAAMAIANGKPIPEVRQWFRDFKEVLDQPGIDVAKLEKINQDFSRVMERTVSHIKMNGVWEPVLHADLFSYLENTARRASHLAAFREQFPLNPNGKEKLSNFKQSVANEMGAKGQRSMEAVIRTMQGLPTDNYSIGAPGHAFRAVNSTIGNLMAKLALTGQMFVQPGETIAGATPVFLGYRNYIRAMAKSKSLYDQLEQAGKVNRVMYDFSWNSNAKLRSAFRIAGNTISKGFAEQWFNEMQETLAATTAQIVSERIANKDLNASEKRLLPQTFKSMGFNAEEVMGLMMGDKDLHQQFQRKAAAWLTSGNKAISEGSALGANRLINSIFRFQSYPMMKMNQFRKVLTNMTGAWENGTAYEKKRSTELFARFMFGAGAQGALTTAITAAFYGGAMGLKTAYNEAKDSPVSFALESLLATISGPLYLAFRGMKYKGVLGVAEAGTRMLFPYSVMTELTDMAQGAGRYRDQDWSGRIASFANARIPGTRPIAQAMAMTGLSQQDKKLDAALQAMYRWKRDTFGFDERRAYLTKDDLREFRGQMRKAVEALKSGDEQAFITAYIAAADEKAALGKEGGVTFNGRKVLRNAQGAPLTEEQKESLRKHIGDDAVDRLEYYDIMLEAAGKGEALPRLD